MIWLTFVCYLIFPILTTPLLLLALYIDPKKYKYYIIGISLNLSLIGYYFVPFEAFDLSRHFLYMENLRFSSIKDIIINFSNEQLIIKELWFYLISITKNFSLLPLTAIFITYYIILKNIYTFCKRENGSNFYAILFLLLILCCYPIITAMSGVRFSVALVLFFHAIFRESILNKKNLWTYLLYVIPCFIHYGAILLILIRLVILFSKRLNIIFYIILLLTMIFFESIMNSLTSFNIPYLNNVIWKINVYMNYSNNYWGDVIKSNINFTYSILFLISFYFLKKKAEPILNKYSLLYDFGVMLSILILITYKLDIISERYSYFILILLPIVLVPLLNNLKKNLSAQVVIILLIIYIITGFTFQFIQLKGLEYDIEFYEFFLKNIFDLLIK